MEAALDFVNLGQYDSALTIPAGGHSDRVHDAHVKTVSDSADNITDKLVSVREFTVTKVRLKDMLHINTGTTDAFLVYVCVSGSASLQIQKDEAGVNKFDVNAGEAILVPAEVTDFYMVPQGRDTVLLEVTIEPYDEPDEYIDPDAESKLPGDDDDDKFTSEGGTKMSVEEFLRKNPGRMN